jgi:hypothetical protein
MRLQAAKQKKTAADVIIKNNSGMLEADNKVAMEIRRRAEAEAERKIKSGNFTSGPGIKVRYSSLCIAKFPSAHY